MKWRVYLKCTKDNTARVKNGGTRAFFSDITKKLNASLRMHPWTVAQLNSSNIRLLSRENLGEKLLDRILPLFEVSEELTRFVGLQPLYDGINLLDPVYCQKMKFCECWKNAWDLMNPSGKNWPVPLWFYGYCEENGPKSYAIEIN